MSKSSDDEIFEYIFRTLEVMNTQELPEVSPEQAQVYPSESKAAQIVNSTENVRQLYQNLRQQQDP